jgi:hypothetical protein
MAHDMIRMLWWPSVIEAYRRLYIGELSSGKESFVRAKYANNVAANLIRSERGNGQASDPLGFLVQLLDADFAFRLTFGATVSEMTSLEEMITQLVYKEMLPQCVIEALWDTLGEFDILYQLLVLRASFCL